MPQRITLHIDLEDQFLRDVMVTMVESGDYCLWYWADGNPDYFKDVKIRRDDNLDVLSINFTIPQGAGEDFVESYRHTINEQVVANAIQTLLRTAPLNGRLMEYLTRAVREGDAGDIDAELADCIAQIACFGELVYG